MSQLILHHLGDLFCVLFSLQNSIHIHTFGIFRAVINSNRELELNGLIFFVGWVALFKLLRISHT